MKAKHTENYTLIVLEGGYDEVKHLSPHMAMVRKGEVSNNLILDLSHLDFVQSYQIGMIIKMKTTADEKGGRLLIVGDSEEIKDILEVVDLGFVLPRFRSLEEAVTSID